MRAGFCDGIDGVSHAPRERWETGEKAPSRRPACTRRDGGTVTVPVVTICRENGELIHDHRVFVDLAPLFA